MSCLSPAKEAAYIRSLRCDLRHAESLMGAWDTILRNKPVAPTTFAALLSEAFPDASSFNWLDIDEWVEESLWNIFSGILTLGRDGDDNPILTGGTGTSSISQTTAAMPAGPYRLTIVAPDLLGDAGVTNLVIRVIIDGVTLTSLSAPTVGVNIDFDHPGGTCEVELRAEWTGDGEAFARITAFLGTVPDVPVPVTLVWASTEGLTYQVQESPDGTNWFIASYAVTGTANTTTWVSGDNYPEGDRPFFRVLELPQGVVCCTLPEIEHPPRFFTAIIGPTGGNPYGGCSRCDGSFDFCEDDPLWTLT